MIYKVAALYQFVPLPDFRELKDPLHRLCTDLEIRGTLLLALEGINGTVAGTEEGIDALMVELREGMTMADLPRCSAQGHERGPLLTSGLLFVALCVETSTCDRAQLS